MITGESKPVRRGEGDLVVAGTVATDSGLRVEITAVGEDTALAGIQRLVAEAQNSSSRAQRIADRAAAWLFWFALGAGVITMVVWMLLGLPDQAVVRTITVLVIACPHALGLAIPLVVAIATERAARGGVLVKDRLALESMRTVDTVLFDKTGTLTKGQPTVTAIRPPPATSDDEVLALAASAEADSEHPLARAIVAAAEHRGRPGRPPPTSRPPQRSASRPPSTGATYRLVGPTCCTKRRNRTGCRRRSGGPSGADHPARPGRRTRDRRAAACRRDPPAIPGTPLTRCTPAASRSR